ncbi:PadR family transcriptional regulator [Gemmatimonas sp.]|uniref:PadR family transcriptional regulator n=1 Tax=Gemmatimonas sp. TaxID=1962908 RepID=UPI00356562B6
MSLRHAILGFLSVRPMSGYDLKRTFDQSVRHFWSADQAAIYRMLSELEAAGLVAHERIAQETRPDRKLFHATASGLSALDEWLTASAPAVPRREPLLVKLFFSGRLTSDEMQGLLRDELDAVNVEMGAFKTYVAHMGASLASADAERRAMMVGPLVTLTNGVTLGVAYRAWLQGLLRDSSAGTLTAERLLDALRSTLDTE